MKILLSLAAIFAIATTVVLSSRQALGTRARQVETSPTLRPVVVELFTSEGCSSCPPADSLLAQLAQQQRLGSAEVIALEEHVDYWDQLGWRDPFSSAQWTERQQEYAASFRNEGVYTPQMVVDGRTEFVGSSQSRAKSAIAEAAREPKAEVFLKSEGPAGGKERVSVEVKMLPTGESREAQVWLAITESGLHSNVSRGENAGEDLHHAAVVRSLRKIGNAVTNRESAFSGGQDVSFDSGWKRENLRVVVFVQDPKSKYILGAASARVAP
ncbi:MAG: DUF1223 domain-containing protein [Candidatus Acidiferrum sp.]